MIENGFVYLPKEAARLAKYLHELTVFPKGKHDDQVDSTAQMVDWFKRAGQERRTGCGKCIDKPRRVARAHTARAVIDDGEKVGPPPLVMTMRRGANACSKWRGRPEHRDIRAALLIGAKNQGPCGV
jgi:hypothetical protein